MSCKTPTSHARSLSPSDESRFVPHASVVEPSSVMEKHFVAASTDQAAKEGNEKGSGQVDSGVNENQSVGNATRETEKGRAEVADDEKSGIVGATICFTPDPSPHSSPNRKEIGGDESSNIDPFDGKVNLYVLNVHGDVSGDSGKEDTVSKMKGSGMHVASSLDDRSITEYEILDSISSKGTIEVEDLIASGEEDKSVCEKKEAKSEEHLDQVGNEIASILSPCSTLPSLNDIPFKMIQTPTVDATQTPYFPAGDRPPSSTSSRAPSLSSGCNEEDIYSSPNMFKTPLLEEEKAVVDEEERADPEDEKVVDGDPCFRIALKLDLETEDISTAKDSKDGNAPRTFGKVAEQPLTPFKNLHKYWGGQLPFTHMTMSAIGQILCAETPVGVNLNTNKEVNANLPKEPTVNDTIKGHKLKSPMKSEHASEEKPFLFGKNMEPSGTYFDEQGNHIVEPESTGQILTMSDATLLKMKGALFASIYIGIFLYRQISSILCKAMAMFGQLLPNLNDISSISCAVMRTFKQILLQKVARSFHADKSINNDTAKATVTSEDPEDPPGTNLSKLSLDEALEEARKKGLGGESGQKTEFEEPKEGSDEDNFVELYPTETTILKRCNDKALSSLKAVSFCHATVLSALISIILVWNHIFQHDVEVVEVSSIAIQEETKVANGLGENDLRSFSTHLANVVSIPLWELNMSSTPLESFEEEPAVVQSPDEGDLRCYSNHMASFVSIPFWEFNLSPTSFDSFQEEAHGKRTTLSFWLSTFAALSVAVLLFCGFIFKSKNRIPFTKPKSQTTTSTGIWADEEHNQFLEGYKVHEKHWKLVSAFVPTRTDAQVSSHGRYWLKVGSPMAMKKARKMTPTHSDTPNPPRTKVPNTPSSVSSICSTPKKSNKGKLKGILVENQVYQNVTPRSARRDRRMKEMEGTKSDPGKRRVRIQVP